MAKPSPTKITVRPPTSGAGRLSRSRRSRRSSSCCSFSSTRKGGCFGIRNERTTSSATHPHAARGDRSHCHLAPPARLGHYKRFSSFYLAIARASWLASALKISKEKFGFIHLKDDIRSSSASQRLIDYSRAPMALLTSAGVSYCRSGNCSRVEQTSWSAPCFGCVQPSLACWLDSSTPFKSFCTCTGFTLAITVLLKLLPVRHSHSFNLLLLRSRLILPATQTHVTIVCYREYKPPK